MNYRHIYHAGNFADVIKHVTLLMLLQNLLKKDKPFAVLDVFAGLGLYNLSSDEAQKTFESALGINKLYVKPLSTPTVITEYLSLVDCFDGCYPGSPAIIASRLRKDDRLIASELHPEDYITLKRNLRHFNNVHIHHIDAYNAIKAFCPPKEKRGLVLIDPAFEVKDEFDKVIKAIELIKKRFAGSTVMIWYPIKNVKLVNKFYNDLKNVGYAESLLLEFEIKVIEGMNKCGIIVLNPPCIEFELSKTMDYLAKILDGDYHITLIK